MREIQTYIKDKIRNIRQVEVKKQQELVGKITPIKGLTLYQMSLQSGKISRVEFEESVAKYQGTYKNSSNSVKKVIYKADHIYVQALNDSNAKRKFTKIALELIANSKQSAND
jgi:hypothetical protein